MKKIIQFVKDWFQKYNIAQKRLIALACTAIFVVILLISVVFSLINSSTRQNPSLQRPIRYDPIPPQELFLPDEPDFVPGVIFERERRSNWTEQDASAFWQDPLRHGEEQWREKVETAIDEILENVP